MLRNETSAIDHLGVDVILQLPLEGVLDDPEGIATIVTHEILYVFQQERFRPLRRNNAGYIEEQRALSGAFKAMWPAKSVLLAHAGN